MRKIISIFIFVIIFSGCNTIRVRHPETFSGVLFKNLLKESEQVDSLMIKGFFKISGLKDVPAGYLSFESTAKLKERKADLKLLFLKKPIIEIAMDKDNIILINHTGNQYITLGFEEVDLSQFIGINFSPVDIYYFLLAKIPYSQDMEMIDFNWNKKEYILDITNENSKYTIFLDKDEKITKAIISDQFFDTLLLESITYTKNDDDQDIPKNFIFANEEKDIKLFFKIKSISLQDIKDPIFDKSILSDYKEEESISDIKIKVGAK